MPKKEENLKSYIKDTLSSLYKRDRELGEMSNFLTMDEKRERTRINIRISELEKIESICEERGRF